MDVRIPEPGGPLLCGTVRAGQAICGTPRAADGYVDHPLDLLTDTAEVLVSAPVDAPITVEVTGYLDLITGSAEVLVEKHTTVVVADSGLLDLTGDTGGDVFWQRNVTIPEPFSGDAICGKVICGVPPTLCGQNVKGDHYLDYTLDLDGATVTLTVEVVFHLGDSAALELDGGPVIVNPVLMPSGCAPLDLSMAACTDLALVGLVSEPLDLSAVTCTDLDLVEAEPESLDLDELVCLEA